MMPVLASFVASVLLLPVVIRYALAHQLYDMPDQRKLHTIPVPRLGGVGVMASMLLVAAATLLMSGFASEWTLWVVLPLIWLTGVTDDLRGLSVKVRFVIQIGAAIAVVASGVDLTYLLPGVAIPAALSQVLAVVLIVGVTNAFNLIDGINGLAGGLGMMSTLALGLVLWQQGHHTLALMNLALAGALLGFLRYNFPKASTFMGDGGSLPLGFMVAVSALTVMQDATTPDSHGGWYIGVAALLLPAADTIRVMGQRLLKGKGPFSPDKTHIHHLLLAAGIPAVWVTLTLLLLHAVALVLTATLPGIVPPAVLILLMVLLLVVAPVAIATLRPVLQNTSSANQK